MRENPLRCGGSRLAWGVLGPGFCHHHHKSVKVFIEVKTHETSAGEGVKSSKLFSKIKEKSHF